MEIKKDELKVPKHIAIILDGNGRWAKKRMLPRTAGHAKGAANVEKICKFAKKLGVRYITMYAFSTENWKRPEEEVNTLMDLFMKHLEDASKLYAKNNFRLRFIGDRSRLSPELQEAMKRDEELSKNNDGIDLILAINYGGRDEVARSFKNILYNADKEGLSFKELADKIDEKMISDNLDTADIPDPELMIRTSGEQRLSNYLIWQLAYTEFYFTPVLWPDFGEKDLLDAIKYYSERDRRFGGLSK